MNKRQNDYNNKQKNILIIMMGICLLTSSIAKFMDSKLLDNISDILFFIIFLIVLVIYIKTFIKKGD